MDPVLQRKIVRAREILVSLDGAVVAFSGGVDSALLLKLAHEALGDRCLALIADSASLPRAELAAARELAASWGVRCTETPTAELSQPGFAENTGRRCFFCKDELFDHCFRAAAAAGLPAVVYGANADDVGDHRPGMEAARRRGARAPLLEAGLTKPEVRAASRALGLPTWDKPAMACLSSRIPYGTRVTPQRLSQVEAAEAALRDAGFRELRVRHHGDIARIELDAAGWERLADPVLRERLAGAVRRAGFRYVALDLESFRSGRMNEALTGGAREPIPSPWPDDASV